MSFLPRSFCHWFFSTLSQYFFTIHLLANFSGRSSIIYQAKPSSIFIVFLQFVLFCLKSGKSGEFALCEAPTGRQLIVGNLTKKFPKKSNAQICPGMGGGMETWVLLDLTDTLPCLSPHRCIKGSSKFNDRG